MKEIRRGNGKLLAAGTFVLGAATGSLATLLCAPASGKMIRRRFALKVQGFQRTAARRLGKTQRELVNKAERVRDAATSWIAEHAPKSNGRHLIRRRAVRHAAAH